MQSAGFFSGIKENFDGFGKRSAVKKIEPYEKRAALLTFFEK